MDIISSKDNQNIKYCTKLASDVAFRKSENKAFVEGRRLVCDIAQYTSIHILLLTETALEKWASELATIMGIATNVVIIDDKLAKLISDVNTPQGVFAVCGIPVFDKSISNGTYVVLDTVQDPGNVGTIIRTAEAFGISQIIMSQGCADIWSPKVIRSTMGSVFRQNIRIAQDLPQAIAELQDNGVAVYVAVLDDDAVKPQNMIKSEAGIAVVIGNEGNGVSSEVIQACNKSVYIPMTNQIESLNAATATTVLAWEIAGRSI